MCLCVAHSGSVLSVNIDGLTQLVVSAGSDCFVRFWKFKSCQLINELKMDAAVAHAIMHRERFCAVLFYYLHKGDYVVCLFVCLLVTLH